MRALFFVCLVFITGLLAGCGGSSSDASGGSFRGISITPSPIRVKPSEAIQLTAVLDGDPQPIDWSVTTPSGGTVATDGRYTAPASSGTYVVRVQLRSDSTKFATANAVVDSGYVVNLTTTGGSSGTINVPLAGTAQFNATVTGAASNQVLWTASNGSISATGLFSAPATLPGTGDTVVITATSSADPGKQATYTVKLVEPVEILDAATTRTAIPSSRFKFKAKVNGTASNAVTWTATSGTIATDGTWTADSTLGDAVITATSNVDPSKSVTATVNVVANLNVRYTFTGRGDVVLALRPDKAPNHCANLVSLVNEGFYDGILIHRYVAGFVVQWGDPLTKTLPLTDPSIGTGGPGYSIDFEANDLLHAKYALGMARSSSLNSAGSQIYICLNAQPSLDGSYVVFGSVASGTSIVDDLRAGDSITRATVEIPAP